jgi:hypothetical protein
MTRMDTPAPKRKLWITISEVVGVLALVVAGLSFWDAHRDRTVSEKHSEQQQAAQSVLVLTGEVDGSGDLIRLKPMKPDQAVQSQTLVFPSAVRADPVQIDAAQPRIDKDWIVAGIKKVQDAEKKAGRKPSAEGRLPVGVTTTYVQDGTTRTDRAIYRIGYSVSSNLIGVERVKLQGLSLVRRGVGGDLKGQVEALWTRR